VRAIYATKANMKKYYAKHGDHLIMFSPYTGEEYSANPGDYFMTPDSHRFKDSKGRVMRLGTKIPATIAPISGTRRTRKSTKKKASKRR